ncbi:quercetin dioxygenase-like cupin family protein [Dyella sp. SG562]|uniref:cupin domain-containing protein n=1 Tax=Dyella sp. SG562 TaxID=2587017 RepID=UPI001ABAFD51|nr:cupin domain-containing protein [Dyella sp. SG562]NII73433.1 quercetin dioxygenase-like cupin family protein [Dyella sp. SG562]
MPRLVQAFLAVLALTAAASPAPAAESTTLLKTTRSWDGTPYPAYASGQPQITVLRIVIPAHSTLAWHHHPVINAAYVLKGALTVEKRAEGVNATCSLAEGEVLPELVGQVHRGYTGEQAATLIVFYAGTEGADITVPDVLPARDTPARAAPACHELATRG